MPLKSAVLIGFLMASPHLLAAPQTPYQPSAKDIIQLKINLCEQSAEKARSITKATIKSGNFDATHEVLNQTAPGSNERQIMQQLFHVRGLVSTVLIQNASFGASMIPPPEEAERARRSIEELTYYYVRSRCIAASLEP